jgi:hypothetical protein
MRNVMRFDAVLVSGGGTKLGNTDCLTTTGSIGRVSVSRKPKPMRSVIG